MNGLQSRHYKLRSNLVVMLINHAWRTMYIDEVASSFLLAMTKFENVSVLKRKLKIVNILIVFQIFLLVIGFYRQHFIRKFRLI